MAKVEESAVVAPVSQVFSPSEDDLEATLDAFLSNREQLLWLVLLMKEYVHRLEKAELLCMRALNRRVCYLFDFDVIQNYLEMESVEHLETFPVKCLFRESKIPFAIPVGAFEELLSYLTSLTKTSYELCRLDQDCDGETAARLISRALAIPNADELRHCDLIEEIADKLDASILELSRLLEVLRNPRFEGVRTSYDEECCSAWLRVVEKCKRPAVKWRQGRPRSKVDKRDAMNLAIASPRVRSSRATEAEIPGKETTFYLLISQTNVVFDLLKQAEGKIELNELAHYFRVDSPVLLSTKHPAIHPREAKVADQLGGLNMAVQALVRLKARIENYRVTTDHLLDQLIWNTDLAPKETYRAAIAPFVEEQRRELSLRLKEMKRDVLDAGSEMHRIEEDRATAESEEQARRRQISEFETPEDGLRIRALQFRRLLGEIASALDEKSGVEYEAEMTGRENDSLFARLRIKIRGGSNGQTLPLITGELYRQKRYAGQFGPYEYFSLRWPIACLEESLIAGLSRIWRTDSTSNKDVAPTKLVPVNDDHECWKQGLVVRTTIGDLYMPLHAASMGGKWDYLRMQKLGALLKNAGVRLNTPDGRSLIPAILQLRINTLFGDIIYDVRTTSTERRRYLTILSHFNVGTQIAQLYRSTGAEFCLPSKLAHTLSSALEDFCPVPS